MGFQLLDIILIVIMLVSGVLALMRGFTREVLSLLAWGLAAIAAYGWQGLLTEEVGLLFAIALPIMVIGVALGVALYRRIDDAWFRRIVLCSVKTIWIRFIALPKKNTMR